MIHHKKRKFKKKNDFEMEIDIIHRSYQDLLRVIVYIPTHNNIEHP